MEEFEPLRKLIHRFVLLSDAEWQLLEPHIGHRHLLKGEFFAQEGKRSSEVAFVVSGDLRQFYPQDNGEDKTTYFYFEGHLMGDYFGCITGKPSKLSIEALTDTRLLSFSYDKLKEVFSLSINWQEFGRLLAEYLALGLEERMVGLLTLSPEQRYLELLNSNKNKIIERIPQQYIANYLGITPVSLSRIRSRVHKKP